MSDLLERARRDGNPIIDKNTVTFVWEGENPPDVRADFNQWGYTSPGRMEQVSEGVWTHTVKLPDNAYVEYIFMRGDDRLLDPFNKRKVNNGVGSYNNYFYMPRRKQTTWANYRPSIAHGTVTKHTLIMEHFFIGGKRDVWLYQPPVDQPVPLLVVFDGKDYLKRGRIVQIVDNMIAAKSIQPIAMALVDNAGKDRFVEYNHGEAVTAYLGGAVLPLAKQELNLLDIDEHPGAYGVLGASAGGLIAMFIALRMPHIFGKVISQSGAFHKSDWLLVDDPFIITMVKMLPNLPRKMWQDVGTMEFLLEANRNMHSLLIEKGVDVTYREYEGGHNYTAWRNNLPDALQQMFGQEV